MANHPSSVDAYSLDVALATDRADTACYVLDVGRNDDGDIVDSLQHVTEKVDHFLVHGFDRAAPVRILYVIGDWRSSQQEQADGESADDSNGNGRNASPLQREWQKACEEISKLIAQMPLLKELTWMSGLPFMACIWKSLTTSLSKLVLDLGQPIRLERNHDSLHKSYIAPTEMKPLQDQTKLEELHLLGMHDSYQCIIWSTVFCNTSDSGMRVLELSMGGAPVVRVGHWRKAEDVEALSVPTGGHYEKDYKGIDGKGILHYSFGTAEYLDDLCMRKARISSGLEDAEPLRLLRLVLDGFVIDYLPFEHQLSLLEQLTCGNNCIDAGLRAPKLRRKSSNHESKIEDNVDARLVIRWPRWEAIFNDRGDQLILQDVGLSTPTIELPPAPRMPLTKESLHMKELDDALGGVAIESNYFSFPATSSSALIPQTPLTAISIASTRGSEVPELATAVLAPTSSNIYVLDGSVTSDASSSNGGGITLVNSASTAATAATDESNDFHAYDKNEAM